MQKSNNNRGNNMNESVVPTCTPVIYSLKDIMDKLNLVKLTDFYRVMEILLKSEDMPNDAKILIDCGNMDLTESLHYHNGGANGRVSMYSYRFGMHYYTDHLAWNDFGLIFRPYGKSQIIFTNEEFVDNKLEEIKELLKA